MLCLFCLLTFGRVSFGYQMFVRRDAIPSYDLAKVDDCVQTKTDFPNLDLPTGGGKIKTDSVEDCAKICCENPECLAITWNSRYRFCFLKNKFFDEEMSEDSTTGESLNKSCLTDLDDPSTWSTWSSWSGCPTACGTGEQTRTRTCITHDSDPHGTDCEGSAEDSQTCNTELCPVDGGFSEWGEWSDCSGDCGVATKTRTRTCNGAWCKGKTIKTRVCRMKPCFTTEPEANTVYTLITTTSDHENAGAGKIRATVMIYGSEGTVETPKLGNPGIDNFQVGATDTFTFTNMMDVGEIKCVRVKVNRDAKKHNERRNDKWMLGKLVIMKDDEDPVEFINPNPEKMLSVDTTLGESSTECWESDD